MIPMTKSGSTLIPSGLAESESNQKPPSVATSATAEILALKAAYTTSAGNKSICAPSRFRGPRQYDSRKTARKATSRTAMVLSQFIGLFHCIMTQTCSSRSRFAESLTRASRLNP